MNSRQEPAPHARFGATLYFFVRDLFKIGRRERRKRAAETLVEKITDPNLPKLAIDCGANTGGVSARLLDAGFEVHAFEPDPLALSVLSERLGNRDGMTIIRSAVGAEAGCALLRRHYKYRDGDLHRTESSSIVDRPHVDNAHAVEVDVIDLCEYMSRLDRQVGLLKIDIEGAEVELIHRMLDEGSIHKIGYVSVETHERFGLLLAWRTAKAKARVLQLGLTHVNFDHP